jgi:hypothetical protein
MSALAPRQPLIFDDLMIEALCEAFKGDKLAQQLS